MLHAAALAHRHEIGDRGVPGYGHLLDLGEGGLHRNRVLDDLLRVGQQFGAGGAVGVGTEPEGAGTGQRFGGDDAIARRPTPPTRD